MAFFFNILLEKVRVAFSFLFVSLKVERFTLAHNVCLLTFMLKEGLGRKRKVEKKKRRGGRRKKLCGQLWIAVKALGVSRKIFVNDISLLQRRNGHIREGKGVG